jgi:hypothetical protein
LGKVYLGDSGVRVSSPVKRKAHGERPQACFKYLLGGDVKFKTLAGSGDQKEKTKRTGEKCLEGRYN